MEGTNPQPMQKSFYCYKCNRMLGYKCPLGLRTDTVTLHMKQSFTCNKCKTRFTSVALAFGIPTKEEEVPVVSVSQENKLQDNKTIQEDKNKLDKNKKK